MKPSSILVLNEYRIAVAIDVREGRVAVHGWTETEALTPTEVGLRLREAGVQWFIYTDILRDGMLVAPNMDAICHRSVCRDG